ncbi:conserved hypothetical protein [Xenorhabdus nematophila F1]|uniref:Uncharacterized protein n=2 Tax=Xenorhabdus nematophila TaxID=628 RepID=D3VHM1_XENNA|nr:hypothetical protein XNC1_2612 [Xenorhabdus nematophila ATCC 19061]CCW29977.1 conserved hypothetical protein [Xenorhabdus nematophila F1]CEE90089.1 hypothetical protein XNA1_1170001 [Xenorhabdus nematophila str. Anatoliense]CEF29704.1 hypothetical protein XNW1_1970002 [Xenorhabdus nematophila str. Websteri]CEK23503.1 hypothetical protein XNC2_2509 [Xenorhabdus nematophila AN6/1]
MFEMYLTDRGYFLSVATMDLSTLKYAVNHTLMTEHSVAENHESVCHGFNVLIYDYVFW